VFFAFWDDTMVSSPFWSVSLHGDLRLGAGGMMMKLEELRHWLAILATPGYILFLVLGLSSYLLQEELGASISMALWVGALISIGVLLLAMVSGFIECYFLLKEE